MLAIGYSADTAWIFPAIIDTAVAVSTMMLVALGDKPARRGRTANLHSSTEVPQARHTADRHGQAAKTQFTSAVPPRLRSPAVYDSVPTEASAADADLAAELIASRVTT